MANTKYSLPWIEKYRPESLDDMIDHSEKINTLRALIEKNEMTHLLFYGCPGSGKCLGRGTLILMHDGTLKKVEEIVPSDQLMGDDSTPRTVLSTCYGQDQMYKIIPTDGQSWTCNEPHILCLKKTAKNSIRWNPRHQSHIVSWSNTHVSQCHEVYTNHQKDSDPIVVTEARKKALDFLDHQRLNDPNYTDQGDIIEISIKDYLSRSANWKEDYKLYKVAVDFTPQTVNLDPYKLGYQLGEEPDNFEGIPHDYKCNSQQVRLAVLAGLIDSDGHYFGDCYYIIQTNKQLLDDVVYIARSLGFLAESASVNSPLSGQTMKQHYDCSLVWTLKLRQEFTSGRVMGTYYICSIGGTGLEKLPILSDHKKARIQTKEPVTTSFTVESIGVGEYYGFELDGNGRFLLDDYTVTHNTSMILACAREMYGDQYKKYILELNASDDRGIETVRKKIPDFVKTASNKIRFVILDEADAMTNDAQSALRRVIEKYSKNSRFCLICNNINKIIPGLQSRCTKMRFGYLSANEIKNKLTFIIEKEQVQISEAGLERVINLNRDFRQILNTLQCLHAIKSGGESVYDPIQSDEINEYLGIPTQTQIDELINILFNQPFHKSCHQINDLFKNNQWNLSDLVHRLAEYVVNHQTMPSQQKYFLIDRLSDIEIKLSHSNDAEVQLYTLISAFQQSIEIK